MHIKYIVLIASITSLSACSKKCDKSSPGTGGKVTLEGQVKHHDAVIPNATVHIKFGATEFPGADVSAYDMVVASDSSAAHYTVSNLAQGDYYLYGTGYDPNIQDSVFGGISVEICEDGGTVQSNVPVTE